MPLAAGRYQHVKFSDEAAMHQLDPAPHQLSKADFITAYGGIYEHSPWVAKTVLAAGLGPADANPGHLAGRMAYIVDAGGQDRQMALLCAHPELAGKLAVAGRLTAESTAEQAGAGLDQCTAAEFDEFHALNQRYRNKFGHPFIIAVRGLDRHAILDAFRQRIDNNARDEFVTALAEVHKIARLRLEQLAQQTA
jgi:2-oxo-4-hydroxy-4-carboxy-5-ureidoimidazoline decarboxylase